MKQWRTIIIFAGALVVLAGVLIGYKIFGDNGEDITPEPTKAPVAEVLIEEDAQDVSYISIENEDGILEFEQKTIVADEEDITSWVLKSPTDIRFNVSFLQNLMPFYLNLSASEIISDNLDDLEEYGLEEPFSKLTINLKSGDDITLYFGDETTSKQYRYVYMEGKENVYTVSGDYSLAASVNLLDLLDSNVFDSIKIEDLTEVRFGRSTDDFSFYAQLNDDAIPETQTPASWQITSPINVRAHYEGFQKFLNELVSITPLEFIERNPTDLEKYGLDNPKYAYTLTAGDREIRVIIGGNAGDFKYYAYTDYSNAIFTISEMLLNHIDKPATELADVFVHSVSIWEVNELSISLDNDIDIYSEIVDDQGKENPSDFTVNGQDANVVNSIDSSYFRTFYQSVISIRIAGFDPDASPENMPELSIEYKMKKSDDNMLLEFTKRDDVHYYVFKNGVYSGIYINRADFFSTEETRSSIVYEYENLLQAMENQRDGVYN